MKRVLLSVGVMLTLAGCSQHAEPTIPVNTEMVAMVNQYLAMPMSDGEVMSLAAKTCRDFSYIYSHDKVEDYLDGFAATQTQDNHYNAGRAIGTMLGYQCPSTAGKVLRLITT